MNDHPQYEEGLSDDPRGDRCVCGGIRNWHAPSPHGCDDCPCTEFRTEGEAIRDSLARQDAFYREHDRTVEATS